MIRSLVDIYRHEGYLPDCRMSLCKGHTQGGSNADVLIADAFLKNVSDIDWDTAYEAIVKDAEVEPANWDVEGRGGLRSWKELGYIPTDDYDPDGSGLHTRSISRTVEYAYNDFCIAEVAKRMGHQSDYEKYTRRASSWQSMFNENQRSSINGVDTGFTGFLQPRYLNGTWGYQDPIFCSPLMNFTSCYLDPNGHETYEGSCWLYTFYAPQDMALLIKRLGGPQLFTSRLSYLHDSGLLYVGDEQAFLTVFQFHYSGRPALSAERAHFYIPSQFNTSVSGIPGNDDGGAMGSFAVLSMMGLFPVHGQDVYLITPPFFKEISIRNSANGKVSTIRNLNFDPSYEAVYIQSARRDGEPWMRNWIGHDFFAQGGVLELELGLNESTWGTRVEDLPPTESNSREADVLKSVNHASSLLLEHLDKAMIPSVQDRFLLHGPNGIHPCHVRDPAMCSVSDGKEGSYERIFPAGTARSLIAQPVLAVEYIHARRVVHTDLRLGNILLRLPVSFDQLSIEQLYAKHQPPAPEPVVPLAGQWLEGEVGREAQVF
ncbi:hypothetical protein BBP40_005890 [Aspergillus hancockii]|nr:hypothetical protein BBP40_005890 [Aspergillus hancockii]